MSHHDSIASAVEADVYQIAALHRLLSFTLAECLEGNVYDTSVLEGAVVLTRVINQKFNRVTKAILDGPSVQQD
nr:hypothetical protein [Acetobacter persici]